MQIDTTHMSKPQPVEKQQHSVARPCVVIVGAGFGGLTAAKALGKVPVQVTVIDYSNHHLFQPMLYEVAIAGLSSEDISAPIRSILRKQRNTEVLMDEVTGVDLQGQWVLTPDQAIPYDYLILATGASNNYFGHEGWKLLAPSLKSLHDAMVIRSHVLQAFEAAEKETDPELLRVLLTFVLVGGWTDLTRVGFLAGKPRGRKHEQDMLCSTIFVI